MPTTQTWEHVAVTAYDPGPRRENFYVDGQQVATRAFTGNVGDSNTWRIGAYGAEPTGFFDGLVDEVRIYDRALAARRDPGGLGDRRRSARREPAHGPGSFSETETR